MRDVMGFAARYTADEALSEFVARPRYMSRPETLAAEEKRLRATLERRRRSRE